jgi:PAS domain S-box-containing protein
LRSESLQRANSERLAIFERLADNASQGIAMRSADGELSYANPALRRMLDIPADAACGDYSLTRSAAGRTPTGCSSMSCRTVSDGQWSGELELRSLQGRRIPACTRCSSSRVATAGRRSLPTVLADLSERQRMEERNRQLLAEMETLLSNALVGIVHLRQRRVVSCNRRLEEIFGYRPGELIGQSSEASTPATMSSRIGARAYAVVAEGRELQYRTDAPAQGRQPVLGCADRPGDRPGQPHDGSIWVFADISERQQAEEESRNLLQAVEQSPVAIVITNRNGEIEYVNPSFTRVTGYSRLEAIGQNPRILKSGEAPVRGLSKPCGGPCSKARCGPGSSQPAQERHVFWERASIAPVFGDHGEVTHYLAVKEDVTERLLAEKQLRESEEAFRRLFEDAKDPLLLLKDGSFIDCNTATLELLGYPSKAELLGQRPDDISPACQPDGQPSKDKAAAMMAAAHSSAITASSGRTSAR